jgi:predicted phosphodiesterase
VNFKVGLLKEKSIMLEMKMLAIGDPHGDLEKVKRISVEDVDLILLTGDLGNGF